MSHRSYNQRDANQPEIVAALRERGAYVVEIEHPVDLLVGYAGAWCLVEVKSGPKARIRPSQKAFVEQVQAQNLPAIIIFDKKDLDYWFPKGAESSNPHPPQNVGTGGKNCELLPKDSSTRTAE